MSKTLTLRELAPLEGIPLALEKVDRTALSEVAAILLDAALTGKKPKPASGGFFTLHVYEKGNYRWEYVYHDVPSRGKRTRRGVGRIRTAAEELTAAAADDNGKPLDIERLSHVLKPKPHRPLVRRPLAESYDIVMEAIRQWWEDKGYPPNVSNIAAAIDVDRSTVSRYVRDMAQAGMILYDGPGTLRLTDESDIQPKG